jgi:hypothetical protein
MMKTVKDHIEATRKRLAEAAVERQTKLPSGTTQPKKEKSKLPKPRANVPKPAKKPRNKGK